MLLGLQAVMLGFAALPLYLFARTQLTRGAAVVLAFCYLLFAPLHGASFYDFHWLPLAIFFHFWLYFAIATRRNWLVAGCYLILVLIREDVSVGLTCLGLFLVLSGVRVRLGFILMCCSAFAFAFIKFGIMRWAGPFYLAGLIYSLLVAPGEEGFGSVIRTLLTNPMYVVGTLLTEEKLIYALHLFGPLVLLPLRRPRFLALIGGGLFFTLLTTAYSPTVSIRFQYPTHWIPYLFAATVLMVGYLSFGAGGAIRRRSALAALAFGVTVHSYVFGAVLQHDTFVGGFYPVPFHITEAEKRHYADLMTLVDQIPKTASVAATEQEVPHVSTRAAVYTIRAHHGDADYLLINRNGFATNERNVVKQALKRNQYGFVDSRGSFYLFARGQQSPRTDSMLTSLGLPSSKKTN